MASSICIQFCSMALALGCALFVVGLGHAEASTPAAAVSTLSSVYSACGSYDGQCNSSAACVAAIATYREKTYQIEDDFCGCYNEIGYRLIEEYPTVNQAVSYISNCVPNCIYTDCPFSGQLIAILSNGAPRAAPIPLSAPAGRRNGRHGPHHGRRLFAAADVTPAAAGHGGRPGPTGPVSHGRSGHGAAPQDQPLPVRSDAPGSGENGTRGVALIHLKPDSSQVCYNLTSAALSADAIKEGLTVAIKRGMPMQDGAVVVLLLSDATPGTISGCLTLSDFQIARDIAYAPLEYFLDVSPKPSTVGSLRGTLATSAVVLAPVSASACNQEAIPESGGPVKKAGFVSLYTDAFRFCYKLGGIVNNTETNASVNAGDMCVFNGSTTLIPLFGSGNVPAMMGCMTPGQEAILQILSDPSSYFASLTVSAGVGASNHTELKGKLTTKIELAATLDPANAIPSFKSSGKLTEVSIVIGEGSVCFSVTPGADYDSTSLMSLRAGATNVTGDVLTMFFYGVSPAPTSGCVPLDNDVIAAIAVDPASYFISRTTEDRPFGAGRGQLHYV